MTGKFSKLSMLEMNDFGVVWKYGGGPVKSHMIKLMHPRYAEETPDGTVLISDREGNIVFEVDKDTLRTVWSYRILLPNGVHRLDDGTTLIAGIDTDGYGLVVRVDKSGNEIWRYKLPKTGEARDALLVDDKVICTYGSNIRKVDYATKTVVWDVDVGTYPCGLFHIVPQNNNIKPSFASDRSGDYLVGDGSGRVFEIRDSDGAIVWQYGSPGSKTMHAYNKLGWATSAVIGWSDTDTPFMFISDAQFGRVFAINRDTHTVWQYGYSHFYRGSNSLFGAAPYLITPDGISITSQGNLLIADSGGSKVIEIVIKPYRIPVEWAHFFEGLAIRDTSAYYSDVAETGWYPWKRILIYIINWHDQPVNIEVQGSWRASFNNAYTITSKSVTTNDVITLDNYHKFIRLKASCTTAPTSGGLTAFAYMFE
jgi:outer membrane protein assembly factor BamB